MFPTLSPSHALTRAEWTYTCEPVFLVGAERSGTTWLQALLAAHRDIYTGPETHYFRAFAPVRSAYLYPRDRPLGLAEYWTYDEFCDAIAEQFWGFVSALPKPYTPPVYFLEKSPAHVRNAPFILDVFPKARFIHLVRDGRDVTASLLRISKTWGTWAPDTATVGARWWLSAVECGRSIPAEITRCEGDPDRQYLELRYEALKHDPEHATHRLFEWLGLDPEVRESSEGFDSIPSIGKNKNAGSRDSYPDGFVGPSVNRSSGGSHGLTPVQRQIVDAIAGPVLREMGYATGPAAHLLPTNRMARRLSTAVFRRVERALQRASGSRAG